MTSPSLLLAPGSAVASRIDAYRTCEFVTLGKDGAPIAWPTSGLLAGDGTFVVTTSPAFPQKAFNVRRDARVALLFSDPTASGLDRPGQILVRGTAVCPAEIHTVPDGVLGRFWARMFQRQPKSGGYLDWPATLLTDFYFMRLIITVTPDDVSTRPLPEAAPAPATAGAGVLAGYATVVLAATDAGGAPVLVRTTAAPEAGGYRVAVPDELKVGEGAASLLVHRHDERLWNLHNANVQGQLRADGDGWVLTPGRVIQPSRNQLQTLRDCRATTKRYLRQRNISRPKVPWDRYRAIRAKG